MKMRAILAVNNLGYIGLNNGLPWRCLEDFKHFKALTMDSTLLVGHRTHSTLPLLKGRRIVLDERGIYKLDDIDWCIGGKATYEKYMKFFTEMHISYINDDSVGDTKMPDLYGLGEMVDGCKIFEYNFNP